MELQWLGHATVLIEMSGTRLLTDPIVRDRVGPLIRIAAPVDAQALAHVDGVLLSHLHADHTQPASLREVTSSVVLVPRGAASWLRRRGLSNVHELSAGDEAAVGHVRVHAVAATHDGHRSPLGPSADAIGFVLRGSHSVYFAGDTDIYDEMAELSGTIDVALLPVWGWGPKLGPGHLDPERAARAAALIAPRIAIPIHWGTFALPRPLSGRAATMDPPREFATYAKREAPGVEVRLLEPGQRIVLP